MKLKILLSSISFLLLFNLPAAKSQNYQTVNSGLVRYFKVNQIGLDENIQAAKTDSADLQTNGDSLLYFHRIMRDTAMYNFGECTLDTNAASWMGSRLVIKPGGENLFFNKSGDTIRFNTQAEKGDNWLFFRQHDFYLQASLDSIILSTINGSNDSVKVISLQAYSNSGLPVENWFNDKAIHFSKNYGFASLYSLYDFPQDTNLYESFAFEPLTIGSIYDFEVGDVFHFESGLNYGGPPLYEVLTILEKWLSSGNDTIYYRESKKSISNELIWNPDPHIVTTTQIDTITAGYANPALLISDLLPHQKNHQFLYNVSYNILSSILQKWNGRPTITFNESSNYMFDPGLNCFTGAFEPSYFYKSYTKGCGNSNIYQEDPSVFSGFYFKMKYFKKGTEIWGDPYILTSVNEIPNKELLLEANPNPFIDQIEVRFETKTSGHVSLYLYSITGKLLIKIEDNCKQPGIYTYHPDLSGVAKGIYILKYGSGKNISYKKLIKN